jgi:hypothetical protein
MMSDKVHTFTKHLPLLSPSRTYGLVRLVREGREVRLISVAHTLKVAQKLA